MCKDNLILSFHDLCFEDYNFNEDEPCYMRAMLVANFQEDQKLVVFLNNPRKDTEEGKLDILIYFGSEEKEIFTLEDDFKLPINNKSQFDLYYLQDKLYLVHS